MAAQLHIFKEPDTLFRRCAEHILKLMDEVLREQEYFTIALAGGNTPRALYQELSHHGNESFPHWKRVRFYFGDERSVPPDHEESNFHMVDENLFQPLGIDKSAIHRIQGELKTDEAVSHYREMLADVPTEGGFPRFDLVLLGIGADGHIASLFPETPLLKEEKLQVGACYVERLESWRYSLTLPVLNNARHILLLASGIKKADVVRHVLHGIDTAQPLPVERLNHNKLEWYLDADAASFIHERYEDDAVNE
jgi:6-phosphogluconolactonase